MAILSSAFLSPSYPSGQEPEILLKLLLLQAQILLLSHAFYQTAPLWSTQQQIAENKELYYNRHWWKYI